MYIIIYTLTYSYFTWELQRRSSDYHLTTLLQLTIAGKHIMTSIQMGQLSVTPAFTITSTCSGSPNTEHWKSVRFNMHILCMPVYLYISASVCIKSWWYLMISDDDIWVDGAIHVFWLEELGHTNSACRSGYFGTVHLTCISPASHMNLHLTSISQGLGNNDCGRVSFIARFRCVQVARYDLQDIIQFINCVWQVLRTIG